MHEPVGAPRPENDPMNLPRRLAPIAPLIIRGEEWRHRRDPENIEHGMVSGGQWVRRVDHSQHCHANAAAMKDGRRNIQHYGARSPHPETRRDCELMLEYIDRLADRIGGVITELHNDPPPMDLSCCGGSRTDPSWPVNSIHHAPIGG